MKEIFDDDNYTVSTDTRTLKEGDVFFALAGENHDAHDHLGEAASKGASALVVSDMGKVPPGYGGAVIHVKDTLRAYQDLAARRLRRLAPFVIAVTGSVGKTTAKDMVACICAAKANTFATRGNLNNQIGVAKTILDMPQGTEVLVLEMGMEGPGEIARLAEIARPDVCIVTNIGVSHRERFDSDDGIRDAKFEITACLGAGGAFVFDPSQDAGLAERAAAGAAEKGYALITVGEADPEAPSAKRDAGQAPGGIGAECPAASPAASPAESPGSPARGGAAFACATRRYTENGYLECVISAGGESAEFILPTPGAYAAKSAAMACAACSRLGISLSEAARALKGLSVTPHRLQPIHANGVLVIDDTYNASPDSMRSGLDYLAACPAQRRIAALADMNELGRDSERLHEQAGAYAASLGLHRIFTVGEKARRIAIGAGAIMDWFEDKAHLSAKLRSEMRKGDAYYVKGSRSMRMEDVVGSLVEAADGMGAASSFGGAGTNGAGAGAPSAYGAMANAAGPGGAPC